MGRSKSNYTDTYGYLSIHRRKDKGADITISYPLSDDRKYNIPEYYKNGFFKNLVVDTMELYIKILGDRDSEEYMYPPYAILPSLINLLITNNSINVFNPAAIGVVDAYFNEIMRMAIYSHGDGDLFQGLAFLLIGRYHVLKQR